MQILISVVNENETRAAIEGGADIIDVKNPLEGSLGANFPHVIRKIRQITPVSFPVSVAIGDVPDKPGSAALAALGAAVCGVQYIKVGLYGSPAAPQATLLLREVRRAVREQDPEIKVIAAAYADAHKIGALPPLELPAAAAEAGVDGCMLDTAIKGNGTLFTHLGDEQLQGFVQESRARGLLSALAGSLTLRDIPRLNEIGPDIVGFRTAACQGGDRITGSISPELVEKIKALVT